MLYYKIECNITNPSPIPKNPITYASLISLFGALSSSWAGRCQIVSPLCTAMSHRDDFDDPENDWDDAIDFGEVTETGSAATDVRSPLLFRLAFNNALVPPCCAHLPLTNLFFLKL